MRSLTTWAFVVFAALSPLLLMSTGSGGSLGFYLLLVASAAVLATVPAPPNLGLGDYARLVIPMTLLPAAVLASQAWHGSWHGSDIEKALRFVLMAPILAAALRVPQARLRAAIVGILAGAWYAAVNVALLAQAAAGRPVTKHFNAVSYGNLTLLLGTLSLFTLDCRITRYTRTEAALKIATALAGFTSFVLTQTRGGWLALPVFILLGLAVAGHRMPGRRKLLLAAAVTAILAVSALADKSLHTRIDLGIEQYRNCSTVPLDDTSICIRLQLWDAAWTMFKSDPLLGIGGGGRFRSALQTLHEQGKVSAFVARAFGETHNDLLYYLATYGVLGALGLLAIYAAPAWRLAARLRHPDAALRAAAAAGLLFCLGFAVFGLSEMMFRGMRTASFYATWIAIFLALSHPPARQTPRA